MYTIYFQSKYVGKKLFFRGFFMNKKQITANKKDFVLTDIIRQTAELSRHTKEFLENANAEQLKELAKVYISNETLKTFSKFVFLSEIDAEKEKSVFLENYQSPATKDAYRRAIKRLEIFGARIGKSIFEMDCKDADNFILCLRNNQNGTYSKTTERAAASIRRDIAAISSYYVFLERRHSGIKNPFRGTKATPKKESRRKEKYPTAEEVEIILSELPPKICTAIYIMAYRGLRVGALPDLKIKGNVFTTKSKGKEIKGTFDDAILTQIKRAGLNKENPFDYLKQPFADGKPRKTSPEQCIKLQIQNHMRKLFKGGKISAIYSAHDFRHFYAVNKYNATKDIYGLSKLLHHSSIAVTETYLKGLNVIL